MPSFATKSVDSRWPSCKKPSMILQFAVQANDREVNFRRDRIDVAMWVLAMS